MKTRRSIVSFGGDPSGHHDSSAAFADAAEWLNADPGREVVLKPGDYDHSNSNGPELSGARQSWQGQGNPVIHFDQRQGFHLSGAVQNLAMRGFTTNGAATGSLYVRGSNSANTSLVGADLSDLALNNGRSGINLGVYCEGVRVRNLKVNNMSEVGHDNGAVGLYVGLKAHPGPGCVFSDITIDGVEGDGGATWGMLLDCKNATVNNLTIRNVTAHGEDECAGFYARCDGLTATNIILDAAGSMYGMYVKGQPEYAGRQLFANVIFQRGLYSDGVLMINRGECAFSQLWFSDTVQIDPAAVVVVQSGITDWRVDDATFKNCKDQNGSNAQLLLGDLGRFEGEMVI